MVRIRFTQPARANRGGPQYAAGEVADVGEDFAAWATSAGVAVMVVPEVKAPVHPPADKMLRHPGKAK